MLTRILIADDHVIIRKAIILVIKEILSPVHIFEANDFNQLTAVLKQNTVDLLICDINMPGSDNFRMIDTIRFIQPEIKILLFTAYKEELFALRYLQAGANGYLHKESTEEEIKKAIQTVLFKGKYLSERATRLLMDNVFMGEGQVKPALDTLSNREMEVAQLLNRGMGLLEISKTLHIQISTVSTYKSRIYEKLQISNIAELFVLFQNR